MRTRPPDTHDALVTHVLKQSFNPLPPSATATYAPRHVDWIYCTPTFLSLPPETTLFFPQNNTPTTTQLS